LPFFGGCAPFKKKISSPLKWIEVAATDFHFKNPTQAAKVELNDLKGTDALPDHFTIGGLK